MIAYSAIESLDAAHAFAYRLILVEHGKCQLILGAEKVLYSFDLVPPRFPLSLLQQAVLIIHAVRGGRDV